MEMINEGAESKIYLAKLFGASAILKSREPKAYRAKELDASLRRARTKREARAMLRASSNSIKVPKLLACGASSLYMERMEGRLLKDSRAGKNTFSDIGTQLAKMHNCNIVHGDFTPANIMLCKDGICIIDFGLADISNSTEGRALDLLLMKRSISRKRYEAFERNYAKSANGAAKTLNRLAEIEQRGRYQTRTLL